MTTTLERLVECLRCGRAHVLSRRPGGAWWQGECPTCQHVGWREARAAAQPAADTLRLAVVMPRVSRALARRRPAQAYQLLRLVLAHGLAGKALLELVRTEPGWPQPGRGQPGDTTEKTSFP